MEFVKISVVLDKFKLSIPKCILGVRQCRLEVKDAQIVLTAVAFSHPDKILILCSKPLRDFLEVKKYSHWVQCQGVVGVTLVFNI